VRGTSGEPVDVWLRHGRPARFIWRGRLHVVLLVLDRQVAPAPQTGSEETWLVEATAQPGVAATRYELRHDLTTDRWLLLRA
jgi:hypothetical protein